MRVEASSPPRARLRAQVPPASPPPALAALHARLGGERRGAVVAPEQALQAASALLREALDLAAALELPLARLELAGEHPLLLATGRACGLEPVPTWAGGARLVLWVEAPAPLSSPRVAPLAELELGPAPDGRLSLERRFLSAALRLFQDRAGAPPAWPLSIAPEQARVLPARVEDLAAARAVKARLDHAGLRVGALDEAPRGPLRARVAEAAATRVPCLVVVGQREVGLRWRGSTSTALVPAHELAERINTREGSPGASRQGPGAGGGEGRLPSRLPTDLNKEKKSSDGAS